LIDRVLSETKETLGSIPAQIVTLEIYDEEVGIYKTSTVDESGLSLVALHEAEDMSIVDPFDRELDKYLNANVLKYTGITFDQFLMYPRDKVEKMLKRCDQLASKESEEAEAAMGPIREKLPQRPSKRPRRK
jgi:hypothetical protein